MRSLVASSWIVDDVRRDAFRHDRFHCSKQRYVCYCYLNVGHRLVAAKAKQQSINETLRKLLFEPGNSRRRVFKFYDTTRSLYDISVTRTSLKIYIDLSRLKRDILHKHVLVLTCCFSSCVSRICNKNDKIHIDLSGVFLF